MSSLSSLFPRSVKKPQYTQLTQNTTGRWDSAEDVTRPPTRVTSTTTITLAALVSFILGIAITLIATPASTSLPSEIAWGPPDMPLDVEWTKFKGRLYEPSVYRGPPSKAIDSAWERYTESPWFSGGSVLLAVTEEDIRQSRKTAEDEWFNSTVVLDEANGGGYMATLELFHQLHCLDQIRRATFPDDYPSTEKTWRHHLNHCIEMLRQTLMCHGDTGLVTFHWVEGVEAATPDFSTWHQCRDPEAILEWARGHEAPVTHHVRKPQGAIEMPSLN